MQDSGPSQLAPAGEEFEPELKPVSLKDNILNGFWDEAIERLDHVPHLSDQPVLVLLLKAQKYLEEMVVETDCSSALSCLR